MSQWVEVIAHLPSARFVISSGGGFGMFSTTVPWQAHRYNSPILYVHPLPWLSVRRVDELGPIHEGPGKWRVGHQEHSLGSLQKAHPALVWVVPGPYNSNHGLFSPCFCSPLGTEWISSSFCFIHQVHLGTWAKTIPQVGLPLAKGEATCAVL